MNCFTSNLFSSFQGKQNPKAISTEQARHEVNNYQYNSSSPDDVFQQTAHPTSCSHTHTPLYLAIDYTRLYSSGNRPIE